MKKIIFFIIGFFVVPMIMGGITTIVFTPQDYELYVGFWGSVYLLIYIIFPLLYRKTIKQKMSKPAFYMLIYAVLFIVTSLFLICFN